MTATVAHEPAPVHLQRMTALTRANEIRAYRARLKLELKARRILLADVLADRDPMLSTMPVLELVMSAPAIGRTKAIRAIRRAEIADGRKVGELTDRQVDALIDFLPDTARVRHLRLVPTMAQGGS